MFQFREKIRVKFVLLSYFIFLLGCGGSGTDSPSSEKEHLPPINEDTEENDFPDITDLPDFPEVTPPVKSKFHMNSDLSFSTNHSSVLSDIELFGTIPSLSLGKTTIMMQRSIGNGWANHFFQIEIKDSDGIDGQYQCVPANSTYSSPELLERDCFIRFNHDDYVGYSESWVVNGSSCIINTEKSELGIAGIYSDIALDINCTDMINAFTLQDTLPSPDGADLDSKLSITGKVYASTDSGRSLSAAELQSSTALLSITGGDGIVNTDLQLDSIIGFSYVPGVFFGHYTDENEEYELNVYINAPYDVEGEFKCVNPPLYPGTSPAIIIKDRECLVTIKKKDPNSYNSYSWDSYEGAGCSVTVNSVRLESTLYPLYDFQADISCPNMVTQASTYGYTYPDNVVPSNLNIQGTFNFEVIF